MTLPRLVILHSAGTTPKAMQTLVGPVAGFEVVYPQASANLRWDHLGFADVPALLKLGGDFICGYSSGAFMAMRMTRERQYKGAMMLAGGMLHPYLTASLPFPCPTMLVHGTADRIVPYDGVQYAYESGLDEARILARLMNAGQAAPYTIPNTSTTDGCRAYYESWGGKVRLYTVVNGGHTYPTGQRTVWQPPDLGRVCKDFDATSKMREFFEGAR